ncbi:MAG: hypothetical protein JWM59_3559 [Verrucomicrobiales bacterium]|nr:hypothetical protein [Verrucomicrobiales bacterium]
MNPDLIPPRPEHRQACAMVSRCKCRGSCGNAGIHRDGAPVAGGPDAGPRPRPSSWLAERPWIWFWVVFLVLISVWTGFIMLAVKNQPASVPLSPTTNSRSHSHG